MIMADNTSAETRVRELEGQVEALNSLLKSILTTFVIRGNMSKADIGPLIDTAAEMLADTPQRDLALAALRDMERDLPGYQRSRMGPGPDPDVHDH